MAADSAAQRPGVCPAQQRSPPQRGPRRDSEIRQPQLPGNRYQLARRDFPAGQDSELRFVGHGGSEKARYAASAGYFQQDGTIINSSFQRFTLRANGEVQLSKVLKIGNTLGLTHQEEQPLNNENNEFSGVIQLALQAPPTAPAFNPNGTYYEFTSADNYGEENPVTAARRPQIRNNRNRVTSTFYAELEPLKGLRLRTNVGTDLQFLQGDQFFPSIVGSSKYPTSQATANSSSNYSPSYLIENTLTYDKLIGNNHQFSLLLGQSAQQFDNFYLGGARTGYSTNNLTILDRGPVNSQLSNNGGNSRTRLASYFGRANYEFAGKYLFQAILRYDGSSAFAPGNQFGFFPGASAGWRLSEEEFLKDNAYVSNLKLRVGYGRVGNPLNAGTFAYLTTVNSTPQSNNGVPGTGYVFGTGNQLQVIGGAPTRLQNTDLRWENNEQFNVGIDVGLWKNRLSGSVDLYRRTSPNLIAAVPVTYVSGTSESINTNAAASTNRGIDLAITSNNFAGDAGGLSWTTSLNVSAYRNEITSLGAGKPFDGQNTRGGGNLVRYEAGVPFGSFYGYVADGLFQTPEDVKNHAVQVAGTDPTKSTAPGDIRFKDLNNDGIINDQDRTFIGDPNPSFTYGLNNTLGFKGFDLNIFLQGSQGNDVYNLNRYYTEGGLYGASNASTITLDRWTGAGTSNDIPRAVAGDPNQNLRISSHYIEDGSYMRVKLLTLGYTLPVELGKKIYTQRVRVYVSSQNLLTFTKYKGFDPELGNQGGSFGVDRGVYPQARTFLAGINIGF
ncbi:SusC/RagA family TonB-linked outer membrane protein [Hymenobacter cellulosilyticus]|uniref:SusC/RagA family TonB-linked outer membrane protein n=1 Tax=Hymenobacter cellulosilyticus TaxID=2932248 RepID=A0A8T9Q8W8_9BACT|nr:SusC/RagA family TonB-linked outer membrane protein [Hymenobacter cellulosilyticus]UOQ73987.1 SusC/RagA family TonB-linked outer membrane protein [Hymenobacter cellulosilyticus]